MPTVTTTTTSGGFAYPEASCMDRSPTTGELWLAVRTTTTTVALYKSSDNGVSWGTQGSFTRSGLYDIGEFRIDQAGDHIHMAILVNESSLDKIYYKRIDIRSGSASYGGELLVSQGSAATARDFWSSASLIAYKNPDGSYSCVIGGSFHSVSFSGVFFYTVSIKNDAGFTTYNNLNLVSPTRQYRLTNDDTTGITVSMDIEHNGDGTTSATPNIWASFQIHNYAYTLKLTWQGYKTGWKSPAVAVITASGRTSTRDVAARWDGTRFVQLSTNPSDTTKIDVFERNSANTANAATRITPSHPQGVVTVHMLSYNHATKDIRVFGVGTSTAVLYYVDFTRATGLWGSWTIANATAPLASEWGVRRSTYGTNQYDVYMESGGGSPWTITAYVLAVNFAPTAPTWVTGTAGTVETNGAAFDVSVSLLLDWDFHDPNATDTQGSFALSRQIGAAAVQYFRTSDNTWQVAEVQNTSGTTSRTLTTGQWLGGGGASDPAHVYKVKTWDAAGTPSVYSSGLSVIPSTRVDPTLTAPAPAAILNTGIVNATWTVSEQGSYRVTVTNTATTALVYDSGWLTDPTPLTPSVLAWAVPTILPDGFAGSLTLQTKNAEGLSSVLRTVAFTVDFVEPVAPLITVVGAPTLGGIQATLTQAAATGTQPATIRRSLYHRTVVSVTPVNANPYFETNTTDWTNQGYSTMVRSTAQFHQGAASILGTPTGVAATPYIQTGLYPIGASTRWEQRGWFRSTTANKVVRLKLQWYDVSSVLISESVRDMTPVANTWIWASNAATAPALATQVRYAIGQIGTPAAGDTLFADELVLMAANDDPGIRIAEDIQSGTVTLDWRTVTGVNYEYRGYALAVNATEVYGPWQA